ncbi:MAG: hypothetical protein LBC51_10600 [Treponema sp.]|jgi:hypothetical protein|nr:hypothetical protein [Treponema sp.]
MKKVIAFIFLWVPGVLVFSQEAIPLDDAIRDSVNYLIGKLPSDSNVQIESKAHKEEIADYIAVKVTSMVSASDRVKVVDRDQRIEAAAEMALSRSDMGFVQEGTGIEVGQELGAQFLIDSSLTPRSGDLAWMVIKATNLTTKGLHATWERTVSLNSALANLGLQEVKRSFIIVIENHFYGDMFSGFSTLERDIRRTINESISRNGYAEVNGSTSSADYAVTLQFTDFKLQKPKRGFYVSGKIDIRVVHTNDHSVLFELYEPYKGSAQPTESRAFTVLCELIRYDLGTKFNTALSEHKVSMR